MSSNIILNKNNIVNKGNNKLVYNFPSDVVFNEGDTVAISHLNIYFSWFNITEKNNNNFFQYKWWDMYGNLTVVVDVTIPDGFYSINDLYEYIQSVMVKHGHYLETNDGASYIYFIEFITNATYYSSEIRLSSLSTTMNFGGGDSDYTDYCKHPTTWTVPSDYETPEVIIPSTNRFGEMLGYNPQTIRQDLTTQPSTNDKYSFLNDFSPNMLFASSYIITCSLVDNDLGIPNNVLYSFTIPPNVGFGDLISTATDLIWTKVKPGRYQQVILQVYDQNFVPLDILDPNVLFVLSITRK